MLTLRGMLCSFAMQNKEKWAILEVPRIPCRNSSHIDCLHRPPGAGRSPALASFARGVICMCCLPSRDLVSSAATSSAPQEILPCFIRPQGRTVLNDPTPVGSVALHQLMPHGRTTDSAEETRK
jgi:hypothetical protein